MEEFIISNPAYQKIALQFPDDLLHTAGEWEKRLRSATGRDFFILADTSYGSCCVDEVAAQHIEADMIIHFGHACMTPTSRLPVYYYYDQFPVDIDQCARLFLNSTDHNSVLLIADQEYNHCLDALADRLASSGKSVVVARIDSPIFIPAIDYDNPSGQHDVSFPKDDSRPNLAGKREGNQLFCGRRFNIADWRAAIDDSFQILYIGRTLLFLDCIMMTFPRSGGVYRFQPAYDDDGNDKLNSTVENKLTLESSQLTRLLTKRLAMIEKIKAAQRIGILVGTLAVSSYADIIDSLRLLIEKSGKRAHVVVVGKLNPAKLGNFMEIEVFVNVACPQNSLIDSREYLQPIVTPFEVQLALLRDDNCEDYNSGDSIASAIYERYILDFKRLLNDFSLNNHHRSDRDIVATCDDVDNASLREEQELMAGQQLNRLTIGGDMPAGMVRLNHKQSALTANHSRGNLVERSWWGLDLKEGGGKSASLASEGRSGVARGYLGESISYE